MGGWFARLFILPHVLIGIGLLIYPLLISYTTIAGVETPAVMIDRTTGRDSDGDRYYKLEYEYRWQGHKYTNRLYVDSEKYSKFKVGDDTRVRFLPGFLRAQTQQLQNPDKTYDDFKFVSGGFYLFFMLFWNAIVSVFVFILYIAPLLEWWILRHGAVCMGVIDGKKVEHDSDGDELHYFTYHFLPGKKKPPSSLMIEDGKHKSRLSKMIIKGKATANRDSFRRFEKSDQVCILYSPFWPRLNIALELSDYELVSK